MWRVNYHDKRDVKIGLPIFPFRRLAAAYGRRWANRRSGRSWSMEKVTQLLLGGLAYLITNDSTAADAANLL